MQAIEAGLTGVGVGGVMKRRGRVILKKRSVRLCLRNAPLDSYFKDFGDNSVRKNTRNRSTLKG
ncbi:hypothetical protein J22TS3_36000 [Paenibacillus sp. J22TS3]|nr:hypothetical protein J22TS3_36000 [Paenibacillus sp. J22TS3]